MVSPIESNANDASGNGHNGTLVKDPSFVAGAVGQAIELDGDEDAVDIGTSSAYNLTAFSICAWVNPVEDMDQMVNQMLEWDTDDDGKVGLVEAIRALQISAGIDVP